jgi:hypothetical protein
MKYPITPPPELVYDWAKDRALLNDPTPLPEYIATRAAQWGADQELEACCEWFVRDWTDVETADKLRAARRPKPPSLKEQALQALERFSVHAHAYADEMMADFDLLSRALEQLDD